MIVFANKTEICIESYTEAYIQPQFRELYQSMLRVLSLHWNNIAYFLILGLLQKFLQNPLKWAKIKVLKYSDIFAFRP